MHTNQVLFNHFLLISIRSLWLMRIGRVVNIKKWLHSISFFARIVSESNILSNRKRNSRKIFLAFGGEFTLFAGLEECLKFVKNYKFHATDIDYLRTALPKYVDAEFYNYLAAINMNDIQIYAVPEGKNDLFISCLSMN